MKPSSPCPSRESLVKLLRGQVKDPDAKRLEQHLLACNSCVRVVQGLQPAGTLAEAFLSRAATAPPAEKRRLEALVQHLRSLAQPDSPSHLTPAPESDDTAEPYAFLAPPQADGELGRLGPYRVLKVLEQGGMGVVFQAEDPRLGRLCALKVMRPEVACKPSMKERFLREARAAAQIEHDHIIPIYQVDEDRGVPFIAMPFLKGTSLEDWLRQPANRGGVKVAQVLKLGREIARGLAAAHAGGLIHRDIKPANIWLDANAGHRVTILDFGLARLTQGTGDQNLTQSGAILGTPAYMAPEQARGEAVDGRADLFSLGVVLYRLCTGTLPFKGTDPISMLMSAATDEPAPVRSLNPNIPPALADLVKKLLEKSPDRRLASAQEVVKAIEAIAAAKFSKAPPKKRSWLVPVAVMGLAVAALPAGLWFSGILPTLPVNFWGPQETIPENQSSPFHPLTGPSPFDQLHRDDIPLDFLKLAGDGDPAQAPPELVAALGHPDPRGMPHFVSFALSPDGKLLAGSLPSGQRIQIAEVPSFKEVRVIRKTPLTKPMAGIEVQFSPHGKMVAGLERHGTGQPELVLWSVEDGEKKHAFPFSRGSNAMSRRIQFAFSPDGKFLALGSEEDPLQVFHMQRNFAPVPLDKAMPCGVGIAFLDERTVLTSDSKNDNNHRFQRWDVTTGKRLEDLPCSRGPVHDLHVIPPGNRLALTVESKPEIVLYDLPGKSAQQPAEKTIKDGDKPFLTVVPSPDGQRLAARTGDGEITLRSAADGRTFQRIKLPMPVQPPTVGLPLEFSPDGRHLATLNFFREGETFQRAGVLFILRLDPVKPAILDLLPLIVPAKDQVVGQWSLNPAGELLSDTTADARLQIPYKPPAEYDLRISFTRATGNDAMAPILVGGGHQFQFFVAGFNNTVCGFDSVNGLDPSQNETTNKRSAWLKNGQRYEALFQVRRSGAEAFLDGKHISEMKTNFSNVMIDDRFALKNQGVLGLGTYRSQVVFHRVAVVEISGKGTMLRP